MKRVLGIDPGSLRCGWGVVESHGTRLVAVEWGVVEMKEGDALAKRLRELYQALSKVLSLHRPEEVAIEDIFFAKFPNAALKLGHARGVAMLTASLANLPVHEYPATLVKQSVAGRGRASKEQVGQMARAILGIKANPSVDATDALAVAITHLQNRRAPLIALATSARKFRPFPQKS